MRWKSCVVAVTVGAALSVTPATIAPAAAQAGKADISSPLRAGARPGCRWLLAPEKTTKVCNPTTKVCRVQTVPAQRIWACGTVRD